MCNNIKLGVIGLSGRGYSLLSALLDMDDIDVVALCDLYEDRIDNALKKVNDVRGIEAGCYKDYNILLQRDDLDGVIIATSWNTHVEIATAAMKVGIAVGLEVGGSSSLQECWDLVNIYEETKTPIMLLENCCYGRDELTILNMIKQGIFGEVIHCQGGYEHDLRDEVALGNENRHYRLENYIGRNAELYPTHELGPMAKYININKGNQFLTLTSMSSKSRGLTQWIKKNCIENEELVNTVFNQGDVVTTMIKCANGETLLLTHDTTLPRPYSRGGRVQGTSGIWMEDNNSIHIEGRTKPHSWESFDSYLEEFEHPIWKWYKEAGVRGGHDGMDYLVLRAFIEAVANKKPMPIDVYDAASWMAITCLSEQSIAMGSMPVPVPDFTRGKWINRKNELKGKYSLDLICK